tara:strand:+ start:385 stop:2214 length:1830 start_codon:yes stop_codon:yes gene_type:complete
MPSNLGLVECVPNFSEGKSKEKINQIISVIESVTGVKVKDVDMGSDTNRTVVTFVGNPEAVKEAAFLSVKKASEIIDMRKHSGAHPRMGATDVCPFVPVDNISMEDCILIANEVGKRIGEELKIPVYLYEEAAKSKERSNLANVRQGEYEGLKDRVSNPQWKPDYGPFSFNEKSGATAVGAREFLIAWNINLNTTDRKYANDIAYELRERGRWKRDGNTEPFYYKGKVVNFPEDGRHPCGNDDHVADSFEELSSHYKNKYGKNLEERYKSLQINKEKPSGPVFKDGKFDHVKAIGWVIDEYKKSQISMNLTNYKISPPHLIYEEAIKEANKRGIMITGSEIVGLIPYQSIKEAGLFYLRKMKKSTGLPSLDIVENGIQSLGLRDVSPFEIEEKVLGLPLMNGELVNKQTFDFVDEVSRDTPAPGGGSVAALAGSLGAALGTMVANLSVGKSKFDDDYEKLCKISETGQIIKDSLLKAVDEDTNAFDSVIEAMRMPKDTKEEKETRSRMMQEGYKKATDVPLQTVKQCLAALRVCCEISEIMDAGMASDVGSGALLAKAGAESAGLNVKINLKEIKDEKFKKDFESKLNEFLKESNKLCEKTLLNVNKKI